MFITDKTLINDFSIKKRLWQGIPSIEVTKGGRIFLTYYSGGTKEEIGNYCILSKSDDGEHFKDIAITYNEGFRCYDPCLWIDPLSRLWFTWGVAPDHAVWASICEDPDAEKLSWSEPRIIGHEVMMNKPTVLSTGEWLFPIAVWNWITISGGNNGVVDAAGKQSELQDRLAFAYKSIDNGATFEKLGGSNVPKRSFDEHMILELNDGRLAMYVRTTYGIGVSYSYDRGKTWTNGNNSGLGGPCSRFFIRRLKSGRILLINHYKYVGRSHLTAMLSEDDGNTWPYKLLLDERANVSYPDAKEADDGYIYITYDRERGAFLNSLDQVYALEVFAYDSHKLLPAVDYNDATVAVMKFPNGIMGKVFISTGCKRPYTSRTLIYGTKGTAIWDDSDPENIYLHTVDEGGVHLKKPSEIVKVSARHHNITKEYEILLDHIKNDTPVKMSAREGAKTAAVCFAIIESSMTGKPIVPNYEF